VSCRTRQGIRAWADHHDCRIICAADAQNDDRAKRRGRRLEDQRPAAVAGHFASDITFQRTVNAILVERVFIDESASRVLIVSKLRMVGKRRAKPIEMMVSETAIIGKIANGSKIQWLKSAMAK
jgi:hypothetical protein